MKSAVLRQRPACGAAPRRWQLSLHPGVRVSVIVPSKDNASGSSGKRIPMLWTFTDISSKGVLKHKRALEEVYNRHAPGSPEYDALEEAALLAPEPRTPDARVDRDAWDADRPDAAALRERLESAALASTSAPSGSHHQQYQQQQQQQQEQELQQQQQQQQQRRRLLAEQREQLLMSASAVTGARVAVAAAATTYDNNTSAVACRTASVTAAANGAVTSSWGPGSGGSPGLSHGIGSDLHSSLSPSSSPSPSPSSSSSSSSLASNTIHQRQPANCDRHSQLHQTHDSEHQPPLHLHPGQPAEEVVPPLPIASLAAATVQADVVNAVAAVTAVTHDSYPATSTAAAASSSSSTPSAALAAGTSSATRHGTPTIAETESTAQDENSIPGSIWILCCISAALTCASCVFNTALPIYMVSELKMSMRSMGMFEGLLEAFSYVVRMCSGVVSDRMTSRKAAITLGFAAGAAAKFGMASAGTVALLFAGKAVDRLANGVQAAPRDALIGDLSPAGVRSACFGLAQSLRKWGSAVGALGAFFLMKASNNNYQLIFYSAATVSLVACLAFVLFVPAHTRPTPAAMKVPAAADNRTGTAAATPHVLPTAASADKPGAAAAAAPAGPLAGVREFIRSVASMGADFYRMLGVISLYALGHINESLLEARAMEVGFGKAEATLVVAALAVVTFLTAFPLGRLDDKYGAGTTFAVGIGALIAGDLVLLLSGPHPMALFAACLFLGVHWAVIQGPLLSIVSGLAPGHLRGTAFGIFYTVMALTAVGANTMYGSIWHTYGANAAFMTSAALMSFVLAMLPYMLPASVRRGGVAAASAPAPAVGLPGLAGGEGGKGSSLVGGPVPAAA